MKTLIAKNLANQCSTDELLELGHWMDSSDRNRNLFYQYQLAWKFSNAAVSGSEFNDEAAWLKLQERIAGFENQPIVFRLTSKPPIKLTPVLLRIAAVLVLALAGWYLFQPESSVEPEAITLTAETTEPESVVLPDGTQIALNKGSRLTYSTGFNQGHRNVDFEGEAYFDIVADAGLPFVISTSNLKIKVLGTSFNLVAIPDHEDVLLYLKTGRVQVNSFTPEGDILEQIIVNPGEKAIFEKSSGLLKREIINDNNFLAWKTGILEFNNAPLKEVLEVLENTYDLHFVLEHNCSNLLLTARFDNETPESIFQTLELIFNLEITPQESYFLIR